MRFLSDRFSFTTTSKWLVISDAHRPTSMVAVVSLSEWSKSIVGKRGANDFVLCKHINFVLDALSVSKFLSNQLLKVLINCCFDCCFF